MFRIMKCWRVLALVLCILVFLVLVLPLTGCASYAPKAAIDKSLIGGHAASVINVKYITEGRPRGNKINIFVDDLVYLTISPDQSGKFVIPDGEHFIFAEETGILPTWLTTKIKFIAESNELNFTVFIKNEGTNNNPYYGLNIRQGN